VRGGLRKLAAGNDTRLASRITFGQGCNFSANWFDIAGTNAVVAITNNAIIRSYCEIRFVEGNASQLSLDGGTLCAMVIGVANANNQHLSLKPVLFNGTVIEAQQSSDFFVNLAEPSAAPLIRNGGAIFDTQAYSVAIRGRGFAQEPGSSGRFVKLGAGVLKIAAPMTYTGETLVSNGTLRLDFALWKGTNAAENLLPAAAVVRLAAGASLEVAGATNAAGAVIHRQSVARIEGEGAAAATIRVEQADLAVHALQGAFMKTGPGTLALACDAAGNATLPASLTVQEGVFAVRGSQSSVTVSVPYAGFETEPLLPASPQSSMDKRGVSATGCPGWTFCPVSGPTFGGYQRNGSYFSSAAAANAPEGVQTAFIKSNGWMQVSLAFPTNGSYSLMFRYCSRVNGTTWYTNQVVRMRVDGTLKETMTVVNRSSLERTVSLGQLTAGIHTLRFEGSYELPAPSNDPCTLIDDVRVTGVSDLGGAGAVSNEDAVLTIASGAQVDLDYTGAFTVGELVIDGVTYRGGYYGAATHPAVFSGTGLIRAKQGGTQMILR